MDYTTYKLAFEAHERTLRMPRRASSCGHSPGKSFFRVPAAPRWGALALAHFRKQAQNLEVQPYKRDHQCKGAIPLHILRSSGASAAFDEVEVEHQVESCDDDHEHAEAD